jgi:hypothetical protein
LRETLERLGPTGAALCPNKVALPTNGRLSGTDFLKVIAKQLKIKEIERGRLRLITCTLACCKALLDCKE